jgi:hypothetical protein
MKSIFCSILIMFSLNVLGQSYLIMDNGVILTTDRSGFVYDLGHYAYPQDVTLRGGQFFVEAGHVLVTVDEQGLLHRKYEALPAKPKGRGMNYLLSSEGELFAIDQSGQVHYHQDDSFKYALNFGGNYFTVKTPGESGQLQVVVIKQSGELLKVNAAELGIQDIVSFGGTYFMTNRGILFTVSLDGELGSHQEQRIGVLVKRGGNFFTDSAGAIFTVNIEGAVVLPAVPLDFDARKITRTGSNYFLTATGLLFVVDAAGNIFERKLADHPVGNIRVISL